MFEFLFCLKHFFISMPSNQRFDFCKCICVGFDFLFIADAADICTIDAFQQIFAAADIFGCCMQNLQTFLNQVFLYDILIEFADGFVQQIHIGLWLIQSIDGPQDIFCHFTRVSFEILDFLI